MTTDKGPASVPVYTSYSTLGTFLDWLKDMTAIPTRIDRSLWSTKFSGAGGLLLMAGLQFLKLLDGDKPTDALEDLVLADPERRKTLLLAVLRNAYGPALVDELPKMTPRMLDDGIRALGSTDATHRKAVSFFVNAAKALGLNVPANIAKKARNKSSMAGKKKTVPKPLIDNRKGGNGSGAQKPTPGGDGIPEITQAVTFQNGAGFVRISYFADGFKISEADEDLLNDLIKRMRRHNELPGGDASRPEETRVEGMSP